MGNAWTIAWKDFRHYFNSPIAYIVITGFLLIMGWMFFNNLVHFSMMSMQYQQMGMGKQPGIGEGIVRPLYGNMNVILLMSVPFITMRLFAEERKVATIQLLMTSPVTLFDIVLGKFLSALMLVLVMLAATLVYPLVLFATTTPEMGPLFACYLGTILQTACLVSIGVLFSSMTENQIVAGALTFATVLFFWLISWGAQNAGPVWSDILMYLSLINHYNNFSQGLISTTDIIYYLSFIGLGLFLTHRVLDSYRWR